MDYKKINIKDGVTFHKINTSKFKTNLFAIFLTTPLTRDNVSKNALLTAVLRRGCKSIKSQELIFKELENMYGASFDVGIEKNGDNQVLKFYIDSVNDDFLPHNEHLAEKSLDLLLDIVFNPLIENNGFKKEYVDTEKNTLKMLIDSKIDNKAYYAFENTVEAMFKNESFGLFKYGYIEDYDNINEFNLYEYYKELISNCKIDVFVSGYNIDNLYENEKLKSLNSRIANYIPSTVKKIKKECEEVKVIKNDLNLNQGKLVIGMDILNVLSDETFAISVYNAILGGGANSKLFQNVREKASLAYTANSSYLKYKSVIFIKCGIEPDNYDKAVDIIKLQVDNMKNGDFSNEDLESAKQLLVTLVNDISESQDGEIGYCFNQELANKFIGLEEFSESIKKVTRADIIDVASRAKFNTIYFLS